MADDRKKRGPQDAAKVNTHESYELDYWSQKFGVTSDQLKAAVKEVGSGSAAVEAHLKSKGSSKKHS